MNIILTLISHAAFLAQATQPSGGKTDPPWWANSNYMLYGVLLIGLVFMMTTSGKAKRAQEKTRTDMLANLKRGDRVQTIGGIYGSVVEARENEVVLKVDESTNTKIRLSRDAIKRVTTEEPEAAK